MFMKYLSALWQFATYRSVSKLDVWQIILASAVPLFYRLMGWPMPVETGISVLAYLGLLAIGYIALRFLSAPYFVWRADQGEIENLRTKLQAPRQIERQHIAELMAKSRVELGEEITRIRRLFIDKNSTKGQMKTAFHGVEKYSDKFWHDELFRDLYEDFCDEAQKAFAFRQKFDLNSTDQIIKIQFLPILEKLDEAAGRLIRYAVHDIQPEAKS